MSEVSLVHNDSCLCCLVNSLLRRLTSRPQTWRCVSGDRFIQCGSSRRESLVVTLQGTHLFSFTVPCAGSLLTLQETRLSSFTVPCAGSLLEVTLQETRLFSFTVPCAGSLLVRIS